MKVLFYSTKTFEKDYLKKANTGHHHIVFREESLSMETAGYSEGFDCVSVFTSDDASAPVIERLHEAGVKFIAVRATGYDNVDTCTADSYQIVVANVPGYSPYSIAEHAVALILSLNRKIVKGQTNISKHNFLLDELVGFDLNRKTVGIIGTGKIGSVFAKIMHGFGCRILASDLRKDDSLVADYSVEYVAPDYLYANSDIISVHVPLTGHTRYMLDIYAFNKMKPGLMLINTARGAIVKTADLMYALEKGRIGYYGADVYENEKNIFFNDLSARAFNDPVLTRLLSFPNVLITPHQAFATEEALAKIAATTFMNIDHWTAGQLCGNELTTNNIVEKAAYKMQPLANKAEI